MRTSRNLALIVALSSLCPVAAVAAEPCSRQPVDERANDFFAGMMRGDTLGALSATLGATPMIKGRESDLQTLARQIQTATDIYGPIRGQECVSEQRIGSTVLRRRYVAQHEKMLTRWTLTFIRLQSGWQFQQISYEDQVSTWLD